MAAPLVALQAAQPVIKAGQKALERAWESVNSEVFSRERITVRRLKRGKTKVETKKVAVRGGQILAGVGLLAAVVAAESVAQGVAGLDPLKSLEALATDLVQWQANTDQSIAGFANWLTGANISVQKINNGTPPPANTIQPPQKPPVTMRPTIGSALHSHFTTHLTYYQAKIRYQRAASSMGQGAWLESFQPAGQQGAPITTGGGVPPTGQSGYVWSSTLNRYIAYHQQKGGSTVG